MFDVYKKDIIKSKKRGNKGHVVKIYLKENTPLFSPIYINFCQFKNITRKSLLFCMIADTVAIGNSLTTLVAAKSIFVTTNILIDRATLELSTQ